METYIGFKVDQIQKLLSKQEINVIYLKHDEKLKKKDIRRGKYLILTQNRRGIVVKQEEYRK